MARVERQREEGEQRRRAGSTPGRPAPEAARRCRRPSIGRDATGRWRPALQGAPRPWAPADHAARRRSACCCCPRQLERFILRDQAEDLLRAPRRRRRRPAAVPYGAYGRLPRAVGDAARRGSGAAAAARARAAATPRVVVIFHPLQYPLARAMVGAVPGCELWYGRWDRYECAYDAGAAMRARLGGAARGGGRARGADLRRLRRARPPRARGRPRGARSSPMPADAFPAPDPQGGASSPSRSGTSAGARLGAAARGRRAPRRRARAAAGRRRARRRVRRATPDFARLPRACRSLVWLGAARRRGGRAPDPLRRRRHRPVHASSRSTTPALPYRILKYARLGPPHGHARPRRRAHVGRGRSRSPTDADAFAAALRAPPARGRARTRSCAPGRCAQTARGAERAAVGPAASARDRRRG